MLNKKIVQITCYLCKDQKSAWKHAIRKARRETGYWACKPCTLSHRNKMNASPIGATRINNNGRVLIKTPLGWKQEHRHIMEIHIGRLLYKDEIVHHIDGDKINNDITNLELMYHGEHTALHHTGSKRSDETKKKISLKALERSAHVS